MRLGAPLVSPRHLRCDAPGCEEEMIECHQGEQLCWDHALDRANEHRKARGLAPWYVDDDGNIHTKQ